MPKSLLAYLSQNRNQLLLIGVLLELLIMLISWLIHPEPNEAVRHAARYSGRLSALVFLITFYLYARAFPKALGSNTPLKNFLWLFAMLHVIHLGLLWTNVYLNAISLEGMKVFGGALAYLMIVLAPFVLLRVRTSLQLIYFYYVSLVMILTYVARIKGDFEGAEPFWLHYLAIGIFLVCCLAFAIKMRRSTQH